MNKQKTLIDAKFGRNLVSRLMVLLTVFTIAVLAGTFFLRIYSEIQDTKNDLITRAQNASFGIANNVQPTIWNVFQKSVERNYSAKIASLVLDAELNDKYVSAIVVYGNFGHQFMGRIIAKNGEIKNYVKASIKKPKFTYQVHNFVRRR
jgi:hypothetical protein